MANICLPCRRSKVLELSVPSWKSPGNSREYELACAHAHHTGWGNQQGTRSAHKAVVGRSKTIRPTAGKIQAHGMAQSSGEFSIGNNIKAGSDLQ